MIPKTIPPNKPTQPSPLPTQVGNQNDLSMVLDAFNLGSNIGGSLNKRALFVSHTRRQTVWGPISQIPLQSELTIDRNTVLGLAHAIASGTRGVSAKSTPATLVSTVRTQLLHQMSQLFAAASVYNWDGYGAHPASRDAYELAIQFVTLLPLTVADPEPSVDADGDFSLEWYRGARRVFAVSLNADGTLSYAGLFGRNSAHGTEILGDEIPPAIALGLARVLGETVPV